MNQSTDPNVTLEYGIRWPDGVEEFRSTAPYPPVHSFNPDFYDLSDPSGREKAQRQHHLIAKSVGVTAPDLVFLRRTASLHYSDSEVID